MGQTRAEQPPDPALIAQQHEELARQLAKVLGLHPQFGQQVARRGRDAVIDRAELTDQTGALGLGLLMVEQLGEFMQLQAQSGQKVRPGVLMQAIEVIARKNQVDPDTGLYLLGTVVEMFQRATARLSEGYEDGGAMGMGQVRKRSTA
jgi:hypothetical protein